MTPVVWNIWNWNGDDRILEAAFATKEAADAYAARDKDRTVEECEILSAPPAPWMWWERIAEVYPDGVVFISHRRQESDSPVRWLDPVDDHSRLEPWDGHTQGHCGEHVYVSGTDVRAVNAAFKRAVNRAIIRQDGVCKSTRPHRGDIDGRTVYAAGFLNLAHRAGTRTVERMACSDRFEHDYPKDGGACRNDCGAFLVSLFVSG